VPFSEVAVPKFDILELPQLGSGFLEAVYQEALEIELQKAEIPYEAQKKLSIFYDGSR
jgi:GxxExxY protein